MKWDINDLPIFLAVTQMKGIRAAADKLGMPKSTVSRTISRLEEQLDIRLFDRNTRQFRLTDEGTVFVNFAETIVDQAKQADAAMAGIRHLPTGQLKISMPMAFSREVIGGRLAEFHKRFPDITLELQVTSHAMNLLQEDLDVAFVVEPVESSDLIRQVISDTALIWVVSPDYLQEIDRPDSLASLVPHLKFCERRYQNTRLEVLTPKGVQTIDTTGLMSVNDPVILRDIALKGGGVALLPELYCRHYLENGRLAQICPSIKLQHSARIIALMAHRRLQPKKAQIMIDFVKDCLADYERGSSFASSAF